MSEPIVFPTNDGQEFQVADVDNLGAVAGLQDDRVLAELLRMAPYDGTRVYKAILPYSTTVANSINSGSAQAVPVVQPSGSGNGSVTVNPFRAVVGSRNTTSAAPSPNPAANYSTNALANWRDIRSAVFVGSSSSLTAAVSFSANSSGNPRWDLVYAAVSLDQNAANVARRQKNPSTNAIATIQVPQFINSVVSVSTVTGTPGSTPTPPSPPADSGGTYNVPLALVRIPNGFGSTSTIATTDIRTAQADSGNNPSTRLVNLASGFRVRPATGNNDYSGTYSTRGFPWNASGGGRPAPFMPADWTGGHQVLVDMDLSSGSSSGWSHNSGDVVDASMDWRKRRTLTFATIQSANLDHDTAGGASRTPAVPSIQNMAGGTGINYLNSGLLTNVSIFQANTFGSDALLVASSSTVFGCLNGSANIGLYVLASDGVLRAFLSGTPSARVAFWIMATEQYPNY